MATRQCLKIQHLKQQGYNNLEEWLKNPKNKYVGRKGRLYITEHGKKRIFNYSGSDFANPYKLSENMSLEQSLKLYKQHLEQSGLIKRIEELRGYNLGCWCLPDQKCHIDVLLSVLSVLKSDTELREGLSNLRLPAPFGCQRSAKRVAKTDELTVYEYDWWTYIPSFISASLFDPLLQDMKDKCEQYTIQMKDKEYKSRRVSCIFTDTKVNTSFYSDILVYDWSESEIITQIRKEIEEFHDETYNYCLVHIYRNGNDTINWHNDKEALDTPVVSISLGATRKFRFKKLGHTKGWDIEFDLKSGDLLYMKSGCQRKYVHTVPVERKVKDPRINLTFRKLE